MPDAATFKFDGVAVPISGEDTLLDALLRLDIHPTGGGCLCFGGDCPHCIATVDGISYVRTCQTPATPGSTVIPHPPGGDPPLPPNAGTEPVQMRHEHADVVVIGGGDAGMAASADAEKGGKRTAILDARHGAEVIGIYAGPLVVARTASGMRHVMCDEVVVATGAAEIQPVCPGADLRGIFTVRAAERLHSRGIDLGTVVAVGTGPQGVPATVVSGELVRLEGEERVEAVVVSTGQGEERWPCESAVVGLGFTPRDALYRMADGLPVSVVGAAAGTATIPPCPPAGVVCPCAGVTVEQLQAVWERGFHEMELVKRATLAGTGTCQGGVCLPYLRSFLADRGAELQAPFTARPMTRQLTMGEVAAGQELRTHPRTPLDGVHRSLGARMDRIGGWWRPWTYGDTAAECAAVRHRVSLGDVSTLGKMVVSGPDAEAMLQRIYPTDIATIKPGRSRYALMLNERGYVFDDGIVARVDETRFLLTFTTGGASLAEMWIRDWAAPFDVRIMNTTMSLGAINVTGPQARTLLHRAGLATDLPYMGHTEAIVAGVPCTIFRLSFTGELSYELHHPTDRSVELWERLTELGEDLEIMPHGIEALTRLRLEKGHILIGQDTDFDSTARRLHHDWAINLDKGDFIGRQAVIRTNQIPLDKMLVGFVTDEQASFEGAVLWHDDRYVGYITSAAWSPTLDKGVALGWLDVVDGALPDHVQVAGLIATRAPLPFYDPEGVRARA